MRTALALALVLLLAPCRQAFAGPGSELDATLAGAMKGTAVPGMGVAVIRNDKLAGIAVRGVREMGHSDPVQAGDLAVFPRAATRKPSKMVQGKNEGIHGVRARARQVSVGMTRDARSY
jgi:CubicO group peptidase (beta-lactamase class C family)